MRDGNVRGKEANALSPTNNPTEEQGNTSCGRDHRLLCAIDPEGKPFEQMA